MIRARQSKSAPVGVVGKVLRILEALDGSATGLQLRQIAQQTGIHKSTAYRFLAQRRFRRLRLWVRTLRRCPRWTLPASAGVRPDPI